jgi:hypothetical protein
MREGLGHIQGHYENKLTLHELGELIRRAGKKAGFFPQSEYQVRIPSKERKSKIDWVWLDSDRKPIVAFEIEGPGVPPNSVENDVNKFKACEAKINIILLFQINNDSTLKDVPPFGESPKAWINKHAGDFSENMEIYFDEELMEVGGIEAIIDAAINAN